MPNDAQFIFTKETPYVIYNFSLHSIKQPIHSALLAFDNTSKGGSFMNRRRMVKRLLLVLIVSSCLTCAQAT